MMKLFPFVGTVVWFTKVVSGMELGRELPYCMVMELARGWLLLVWFSVSPAVRSCYDIMGSSFLVQNDALSLSIDPCLARRFRAEVRELEVQFSSLICCRGRACHIRFCMNFLAVWFVLVIERGNGTFRKQSWFFTRILTSPGTCLLTPKLPLCIFCSVGKLVLTPLLHIICLCWNDIALTQSTLSIL
jgi:hypothetical protein